MYPQVKLTFLLSYKLPRAHLGTQFQVPDRTSHIQADHFRPKYYGHGQDECNRHNRYRLTPDNLVHIN